ncbi:hypothetical protein [Rhodobacter sp. TJ_12]|uniref:hypothetical protein n=1 Tax=Rhodobacter sp. TJ_12 TaxID=2029399 RepID=UPI001CBF39AA|nr:hypothetical protein [Rhodobacter sp. TJ_12]
MPTTTAPATTLPLPHGAEAQQGARATQPTGTTLPTAQSAPRASSGAPPPTTPASSATGASPPSQAQTRAGTATLPLPETTLASATTAAQPGAGSAAPGSLIAAQMLGVETAPLQALLAQQAATRALPHPTRGREPRPDAPAAAIDHTPDDSFDPHSPHLPQTLGGHHGHKGTAQDGDDPAADDDSPSGDAEAKRKPDTRRDMALHPPPHDPPPPPPTPWVLAGAVFVGTFSLTVLLLA